MKKLAVMTGGFLMITLIMFVAYWLVINADQYRPQVEVVEGEVFQMPSGGADAMPENAVAVAQGNQDKEPREITGDIIKPRLNQKGPKPYPEKAKQLRRSGRVTARLIVHADGSYKVDQILKESPKDMGFAQAFKDYLAQCGSFEPAKLKGEPLSVYYNITLIWNSTGPLSDTDSASAAAAAMQDAVSTTKGRAESEPYELGNSNDIQPPGLVQNGEKPYPPKAKMYGRTGKVTARLLVKKDGSYEIIKVIKEEPADFGFEGAFRAYLEQCGRFEPAIKEGKPVDVYYNITMIWNL